VPIERVEASQVDEFDADSLLAFQFLRGLQRTRYDSAVRDHRQVCPGMHDLRLAEWNHVLRSGIGGPPIGFAVQAFMLEEENRISTTGLSPRVAIPVARPTIAASARGELNTRSLPNSFCRPKVSLNTPPLPLTNF